MVALGELIQFREGYSDFVRVSKAASRILIMASILSNEILSVWMYGCIWVLGVALQITINIAQLMLIIRKMTIFAREF
jgi:hypothetical protein